MILSLKISLLLGLAIYYFCLFWLLKKERMELRYALLWIFAGVIMVLVVLFPEFFLHALKWVGIIEDVNLVFAVVLFFLIIILMSMTAVVSRLNANIRRLTQKLALFEKKFRELEEKVEALEEKLPKDE